MQLIPINTGYLKIPYGDMFKNLPAFCCDRPYPVDENDNCEISIRSLLIIDNDKKILIDTGVGDIIDKNILDTYHYRKETDLKDSLEKKRNSGG